MKPKKEHWNHTLYVSFPPRRDNEMQKSGTRRKKNSFRFSSVETQLSDFQKQLN